MSIYNQINSNDPQEVSVKVLSKDRTGLVGEISTEISSHNIEIRSHRAKVFTDDRNEQLSVFEANIYVDSTVSLQALLHRLHKIKGVVSVTAG